MRPSGRSKNSVFERMTFCHLSTFDLYASFKAGATLALVPEELSVFPGALMRYIEEQKITLWNSVPSLLSYMAKSDVLDAKRLKRVRAFFFNGEIFPPRFLRDWMHTYPDKSFINMYGPTEATVQCSFYRIPKAPADVSKPVPIGKACPNTELFALTDEGTVAKEGEEGGAAFPPAISAILKKQPKHSYRIRARASLCASTRQATLCF